MLAILDQMDSGVEEIHTTCIGTIQEECAENMRESIWEMRGTVEAALQGNEPPPCEQD
jgi:hypothetical protein